MENDTTLHEGRSLDISCAGACLATKGNLSSKQKVQLTIYLGEHTSVKLKGEIVWNKVYAAGHLAGVVFLNTSPEVQELILDHAFELRKNDLVKHWFKGWEE